ncbi:MAG: Ig domain-containing protein, partial [Acidobacteriota bacterium]
MALLVLSAAICSAQPLTIMTGCPLPQARVGTPYSVAFAAAGGILPYDWQIVPDGPSPLGLSLDRYTGVFSGTPTQAGTFRFGILVGDSSRPRREGLRSCSVTVAEAVAGARLTITTACPLPIARAGVAYQAVFTASGGSQPYRWQIIPAGPFPEELKLDAAKGELAGVANTLGQFGFTLAVTDSAGGRDQKACTLPVEPKLAIDTRLVVSPPSLGLTYRVGWTASAQATVSIAAVRADGTAAPVSFSVSTSTESGGAWLTVNPASGNSPSDVAVFANGKGLAPGEYKGYLSITAAEVVNSPERVEVTLTVAGPQLVVSPAAISAAQQLGTGAPAITRLVTVSSTIPEVAIDFAAALDAGAAKWATLSASR